MSNTITVKSQNISLSYNGKNFSQREEDGFVNLGQLCATHGKKFANWSRTQASTAYLAALTETLAGSGSHILTPDDLVVSGVNAIGGDAGTWGHPLVAIEVARWINPKFGVWCNQHIKTLVETGTTSLASQPSLPSNYLEALKALVLSEEEKQRLEIENSLLEETNHELAEMVDELFDYSSIVRVAQVAGVDEGQFKWHKLKAACKQLGLEVKKAPCPRYQTKNLYPHAAWRVAYPDVPLPEKTGGITKR